MRQGLFEVIVACNGCTDATAEVARRWSPDVQVIELPTASKVAALGAADEIARTFPRLYVDADVILPSGSAEVVLRVLASDTVLAARPPLRYDTTLCSSSVRRYFAARQLVPELFDRLWGAGVYGLSEKGRSRFQSWPDLIADDLFVDSLFSDTEIAIVQADPVTVLAPRSPAALRALLRRGARAKRRQARIPDAEKTTDSELVQRQTVASTLRGLVAAVRSRPTRAVDVLIYAGYACWGRLPRLPRRADGGWERDDSSRALSVDAVAPNRSV